MNDAWRGRLREVIKRTGRKYSDVACGAGVTPVNAQPYPERRVIHSIPRHRLPHRTAGATDCHRFAVPTLCSDLADWWVRRSAMN